MLKRPLFAAAIAALAISAPAYIAPTAAHAKGCPPGLAKKNPSCVPPGLAKKQGIRIGDRVNDYDVIVIRDPNRYGLDGRDRWYRLGDDLIIRADRETGEIIDLIDAVIRVID